MEPVNAIEVEKVSKSFKIYFDKGNTIKEKIVSKKRKKYEIRQVLKEISFNVKKGEAIGLIGQNGCGKSTILKLLTRIMYPDSGNIRINGRVSSLLELGAGFHPDMSGRENIYINASIFGLNKKEIDERLQEIISFSELEEFIDNPVRTYSSGMYMRLAFSVAINVNAEILLIDEILAVGDAMFQAKCFNKLRELKAQKTTIIIVSHALNQIEQICDRSIWIQDGKIQQMGLPREIHPYYLNYVIAQSTEKGISDENKGNIISKKDRRVVVEKSDSDEENDSNGRKETGNRDVIIKEISLFDYSTLRPKKIFKIGEDILLQIKYTRKNKNAQRGVIGFNFIRNDGQYCYGTNNRIDKLRDIELQDEGQVEILFKDIQLLRGKYDMDIAIDNGVDCTYHYIYKAIELEIKDVYDELGTTRIKHEWICTFQGE